MSSTHPQVEAYLDDLARMLADIDPGERDDILASVREHLDAEIAAGHGSDAVVNATLLRLGPPEQVAAAARTNTSGAVRRTLGAHPKGEPGHRAGDAARAPLMLWVKVTGLRQAGVTPLGTRLAWRRPSPSTESKRSTLMLRALVWLVGLGAPSPAKASSAAPAPHLGRPSTGFFAVLVTLQPEGPSIVGAFALLVLVVATLPSASPAEPCGAKPSRTPCPSPEKGSERLDDVLDAVLGVAEQHLRVLLEEERVLHAGVARGHGALEHDDVAASHTRTTGIPAIGEWGPRRQRG